MRLSTSDAFCDWAAVLSGLAPFFGTPSLEPFCRPLLLVAEEGVPLPFRWLAVAAPFEPPLLCPAGCEFATALPDDRWPLRQFSGTIHAGAVGAFFGRDLSSI